MSRSSGVASGGGAIPNPLLVGNGQAIPWTAEEIIGDNTFVQSWIDLIVSQQNVPDDSGTSQIVLFGTDNAGTKTGRVTLNASGDGTTGVSDASFQLTEIAGAQVLFDANQGLIQLAMLNGVIDNGGAQNAFNYQNFNGVTHDTVFAVNGDGSVDQRKITTPAAPAANNVRLFCRLDLATSTYLEWCAELPSGLVVVLMAQPLPRPARYILPIAQAPVGLLAVGGTTLFSTSVPPASLFPANSLKVGDIIRLCAAGEILNNSGGAATMQIIVRIGGLNYVTTIPGVAFATNAAARSWTIECDYGVQALGAAGVSRFRGRAFSNVSGAGNNQIVLANSVAADTLSSFNTGANAALDVLCSSTVSNVNTTATLESLSVEYIPGT